MLAVATVVICRRKRNQNSPKRSTNSTAAKGTNEAPALKEKEAVQTYHKSFEYASDDIYHYASASYQFGNLTPPPPTPAASDDAETRTDQQTNCNRGHLPTNAHLVLAEDCIVQHGTEDVVRRQRQQYDESEQAEHHDLRENMTSFNNILYQAPSLQDEDAAVIE
ncbi:uncharacterized protein LOC108669289, partial [Hyalella azteca]|uniref:Uncharacterized protein LOC108669289 n=1 Tax=Hyalella azteca TaxID=294128 RepID=A0A8B7NEQ6_HYAAZ